MTPGLRPVLLDLYRCQVCRVRMLLVDRPGHARRCGSVAFRKDGQYLFPPPSPGAKDPNVRVWT